MARTLLMLLLVGVSLPIYASTSAPGARITVDRTRGTAIVASVARQCGIRNVMIDPGMEQTGTFRLESVSCSTALRVIFESMGISGELHPSSILVVRAQR